LQFWEAMREHQAGGEHSQKQQSEVSKRSREVCVKKSFHVKVDF
jgi:hypothetical protein